MTGPRIRSGVEQKLEQLEKIVGCSTCQRKSELLESFKWAEGAAYDRRSMGQQSRGTGTSDPTGAVVAAESQQQLREATQTFRKTFVESAKAILARYDQMNAALRRIDPRHELTRDQFPTEPEDEIDKAKEAKARREDRGEGWGVA